MNYKQLRNTLKTGDIVLFSGKGHISELIKFGQWMFGGSKRAAQWSHVGMIVRSDDIDAVLLWESTTLSGVKTVYGENREGVQLVSLSDRIDTYDGEIAVRQLLQPLTNDQTKNITACRKEMKGRAYEKSNVQLFRSVADLFGNQKKDLSSLFCSELVAEALQRADILTDRLSSNSYTPSDFSKGLNHIFGQLLKVR